MTEDRHPRRRISIIDGGRGSHPGRRRLMRIVDDLPEGVVAEVSADRLAELSELLDKFEAEVAQSTRMELAADIIVAAKRVFVSEAEVRSMREDGER